VEIPYSGHRHGPGPLQQYRHGNAEGEAEDRSFHDRIRSLIKTPLQRAGVAWLRNDDHIKFIFTDLDERQLHSQTSVSGRAVDALADLPLGSTAVERRTDQLEPIRPEPGTPTVSLVLLPTKSNIYQRDPQICSVLTTKVRRRPDDRDLKRGSNVTA
jgi:hypothetical protein